MARSAGWRAPGTSRCWPKMPARSNSSCTTNFPASCSKRSLARCSATLPTHLSMHSCVGPTRFMEPPMAETMSVEVCYALLNKQEVVRVKLPEGATLLQGLEASGLLVKYPEIDVKKNKFGIWNKLSKPDAVLRDKDRIEIYRPLIADPKEVRKQRAAEGKVMKKGAGDNDAPEA